MDKRTVLTMKTWSTEKTLNVLCYIMEEQEPLNYYGQAVAVCDIIETLDLANSNIFMRHLTAERDYLRDMSSWTFGQEQRFEALTDLRDILTSIANF